MSNLISINDIFITVKENVTDNDLIDNMITYIYDNFNDINYDELIINITNNLEDELFLVCFINPLINKLNTYRKIILSDVIKSTTGQDGLKNIFLLDYVGFEQLYNIYKFKKINNYLFSDILIFIYNLGKKDILISLLEFVYNTKVNYDIISYIIISFMIFHNSLFSSNDNKNDENINYDNYFKEDYIKFTKILLNYTNIIYPLLELTDIVAQTFQIENINLFLNENNINIINIFFVNILNKINYYYDISLIKNIIKYVDALIVHNYYDRIYELINKLTELLDNPLLNIHDKTLLIIKICKFMSNESYKNIPINIIYYINYYLSNVKFLDWSTFDEKINIIMIITKILFKIHQNNQIQPIDSQPEIFYNLLYNILYYEKECFNIIEFVLKNEITYTTYSLLKDTIYGMVNTLNIFVEIEMYLCKKLNILYKYEEYDYIIYKNNLNISSYVLFLLENNNLYKFNTLTMIHNFVISKYIMIYNQLLYDRLPYIGIDYINLKKYYEKYYVVLPDLYKIKIDILQEKFNSMNKFIDDNPESELIDPLFVIKIENIYKLPNRNEKYEKITLRLLIKESAKNPLTREPLTLNQLDEYNKFL